MQWVCGSIQRDLLRRHDARYIDCGWRIDGERYPYNAISDV